MLLQMVSESFVQEQLYDAGMGAERVAAKLSGSCEECGVSGRQNECMPGPSQTHVRLVSDVSGRVYSQQPPFMRERNNVISDINPILRLCLQRRDSAFMHANLC